MSRRTRTAALLSTAMLVAGAGFSLALAAPASALPGDPLLGPLVLSPAQPAVGSLLKVSGSGCLGVPVPQAAGTDPATPAAAAADTTSSVSITVSRNGDFYGGDTAQPSDDGSWDGVNGVSINDPGDYAVTATCTLLPNTPGFQYTEVDFTVADPTPPPTLDPSVTCSGCDGANPGDTVTVGGTDFPANSAATISLAGYAAQSAHVDNAGGFDPVSIVIAANQSPGTLAGTVSAGGKTANFSVSVVAPTGGGGNVDGTVPGSGGTGGSGGSGGTGGAGGTGAGTGIDGTGSGDVPVVTGDPSGPSTTAAPHLPATGTDSLWPGVIGGLLVLSGTGLLWIARRRDDADVTA